MSVQFLALRHGNTEHRLSFATADSMLADNFLSETERTQLAGYKFAAKKEGFLLGRLAAKRALGALLPESDLVRIEIRSGVFGQPVVHHPRAAGIEVTVSHSHGLAVALAFPADHPMGIDLESVHVDSAATLLREMELSEIEKKWLETTAINQETACGVLWTAREALAKALRTGLNSPLGVFALKDLQRSSNGGWVGEYLNFPHSKCLARAGGGRVLTLALPKAAELSSWPSLA